MRFFDLQTKAECRFPADAAAALGNFDGVHVGHRRLFDALPAKKSRAVFTFADLHRAGEGDVICPPEERLSLIADCGVDYAVVANFAEVRDMTAAEFADFLSDELKLSHVVCGFNFTFGRGGSATAQDLRELLFARGVETQIVAPVRIGGETVSSTAIRRALSIGDLDRAAAMLGRPFSITLPVVRGRQLGRTIGVPTVNQSIPADRAAPRYGVYAVRAIVGDKAYRGICNIGVRPTVDGEHLCAETHIDGFDGDLYGTSVTVELLRFIRDERRFSDIASLKLQIEKDIACVKAYFESYEDPGEIPG